MARGKGNSGPRSRTNSPDTATKNGHNHHKASGDGGSDQPTKVSPKKPSEKSVSPLFISKSSGGSGGGKQKAVAAVISKTLVPQLEDVKKLKTRGGNGLLLKSDGVTAVAVTTPTIPLEKAEVSVPVVRANVAKKSTTQAAAREAMKLKLRKADIKSTTVNGKLPVTANKRGGVTEDAADVVDASKSVCELLPKVKIDVNFEDDSEDSENEGLKQLMENIDQTLVCPPPADAPPSSKKPSSVADKLSMTSSDQLWLKMVSNEKTNNGDDNVTPTPAKKDDHVEVVEEPSKRNNRKRSRSKSVSPVDVCCENGSSSSSSSSSAAKKNKSVKLKRKDQVADTTTKDDEKQDNVHDAVKQTVANCDSGQSAAVVVVAERKEANPKVLRVSDRLKQDQAVKSEEQQKKSSKGDKADHVVEEESSISPASGDLKLEVNSDLSSPVNLASDSVGNCTAAMESETESLPAVSSQDENETAEPSKESTDSRPSVKVVESLIEPLSESLTESLSESEAQPSEDKHGTKETDEGSERKKIKLSEEEVLVVEEKPICSPSASAVDKSSAAKDEIKVLIKDEPEVPASEQNDKDNGDDNEVKEEVVSKDKESDECAMDETKEEVVRTGSEAEPVLKKRKREDDESEADATLAEEKKLKFEIEDESKPDVASGSATVVDSASRAVPERSMLRRVFGVQRQTQQSAPVSIISGGESQEDAIVKTSDEGRFLKGEDEDNSSSAPKKQQMYRMSKTELEMLLMSRVTDYFTDGNKSEIAALRRRCVQLEKALDASKRKANQCQKQITDLQIVIQRAQLTKKTVGYPLKPPMRSVGLQVQLTRYHPISTGDAIPKPAAVPVSPQRLTYGGSIVRPTTIVPSAMGVSTSSLNAPRMTSMKHIPSGLTFMSSITGTGALNRNYLTGNKTLPVMTQSISLTPTSGLTIRPAPVIRLPIGDKTISVRPLTASNVAAANQLGISLLQPRMSLPNSQTLNTNNLVFSAPTMTSAVNAPNRGTQMVTSGAVTGTRPHLEANKIVTMTSGVTPVPMRLVPNQAARQTTGGGIVTSISTVGTTVTTTSSQKSLIGQPRVAAVKLIDLTADEEAAAAAVAGASVSVTSTSLTINTSTSGLSLVQAGKTLQASELANSVPILTSALSSAGQILTINPSGTITTTMNSLRMGTPMIRTSTVNTGVSTTTPMRYAYLVPSTSMVTMVRPTQPLFVTQNQGQRFTQPGTILKPNIPTLVFQRGTTLVPLQGQMASIQNIRPSAITIQAPTTCITATTATVPVLTSTSGSASAPAAIRITPNNMVSTLLPTSTNMVLVQQQAAATAAATGTSASVVPKIVSPQPPPTSTVMQPKITPSVVPKTTPQPSSSSVSLIQKTPGRAAISSAATTTTKGVHPAPLPPQPTYTTKDLVSRKCMPPKPVLKISKATNGIVLSWNMPLNATYADISNYQLYAYQEGSGAPSSVLWKKVGDVRALPLPMACTLTQFVEGHKYYFAVRGVDAYSRIGPFSDPGIIVLMVPTPTTKS